nr:unnamed protein product [Haemonchus contortus]
MLDKNFFYTGTIWLQAPATSFSHKFKVLIGSIARTFVYANFCGILMNHERTYGFQAIWSWSWCYHIGATMVKYIADLDFIWKNSWNNNNHRDQHTVNTALVTSHLLAN